MHQMLLFMWSDSKKSSALPAAALALSISTSIPLCRYLDLSPSQIGVLLHGLVVLYMNFILKFRHPRENRKDSLMLDEGEAVSYNTSVDVFSHGTLCQESNADFNDNISDLKLESLPPVTGFIWLVKGWDNVNSMSKLFRWMELSGILLFIYLCDRGTSVWTSAKFYDPDVLWFVCLTLLLLGLQRPRRCPSMALLQNEILEEWKGWMHTLFLLYHYFAAYNLYNIIRLSVACYMFVAGFTHYRFYTSTGDFSLRTFLATLWRLNFSSFLCCVTLGNDYMMYYLCPMFTMVHIFAYATLGISNHRNGEPSFMMGKLIGCGIVVGLLWEVGGPIDRPDVPSAFSESFLSWIFQYKGTLSEWSFRSKLDHWIWLIGMVCAFLLPRVEDVVARRHRLCSPLMYIVTVVFALLVLVMYFYNVQSLDRYSYSDIHPYTSWIPLALYLVVRQLTEGLRSWYLYFFSVLGSGVIETFVCQHHVWMHSGAANAAPRQLLVLIPHYPLVNFGVVSAIFALVSFRLHSINIYFQGVFLASNDSMIIRKNCCLLAVGAFTYYALGCMLAYALSG
eukprot:Rmarinus@m.29635